MCLDDRTSKEDWGWEYKIDVAGLAKKILDGIDPKYRK